MLFRSIKRNKPNRKPHFKQGRQEFWPESVRLSINVDLDRQNGFSNEVRGLMHSITRKVDFLTAMYPKMVKRYDLNREQETTQESNHILSDGLHSLQIKVNSKLGYVPAKPFKKYKAGSYVCGGFSCLINTFSGQGQKKEGQARLPLPTTGKAAREEGKARIRISRSRRIRSRTQYIRGLTTQFPRPSRQPSRRPSFCSN